MESNHRLKNYEFFVLPTELLCQKKKMEKVGFEPTRNKPLDLQSSSINHSDTFPFLIKNEIYASQTAILKIPR